MIRTITLNTGFDETCVVSETLRGGVAELRERSVQPSGKGVNAARVLLSLGIPTRAYGLVGRADSDLFARQLADEGIESSLVGVEGATRRNLTLLSLREGLPAAHFRAAGFSLGDDSAVATLLDRLRDECREGDIVSLHGSTPAGLPAHTWQRFARVARERAAKLVVDIYGPALPMTIADGGATISKPNQEEMRVLPGANTEPIDQAARNALRWMHANGVELPLITLGARGVMFLDDGRFAIATVPVSRQRLLVGAGDACVAGLIAGLTRRRATPMRIAAEGVATAAAHVEGCRGPALAKRAGELLEAVTVCEVEQ